MHKKKENNAFKFLQSFVFIYDVCIYKMCRIQQGRKKKKKVLWNLFVCLENVNDQTGVRGAIIALGFLSRKIISGRSSKIILGWVLHWTLRCLSGSLVFLDLICPDLWASCLAYINCGWSFDDLLARLCIMICKSPCWPTFSTYGRRCV